MSAIEVQGVKMEEYSETFSKKFPLYEIGWPTLYKQFQSQMELLLAYKNPSNTKITISFQI
jgi:hypothetical protein